MAFVDLAGPKIRPFVMRELACESRAGMVVALATPMLWEGVSASNGACSRRTICYGRFFLPKLQVQRHGDAEVGLLLEQDFHNRQEIPFWSSFERRGCCQCAPSLKHHFLLQSVIATPFQCHHARCHRPRQRALACPVLTTPPPSIHLRPQLGIQSPSTPRHGRISISGEFGA